jgi:gluconate 2-dehydrogenase gamma chain
MMKSTKNSAFPANSSPSIPTVSRRHFLLGIATLSLAATIPGWISCSATPVHDIHGQLSDDDFVLLISVQNHLFPRQKNVPGAEDFNAPTYFTWVISDTKMDQEIVRDLKKGFDLLHRTCQNLFSKKFVQLSQDQKETALRQMEKEKLGRFWISRQLTYIFEALLSDPVYGANTDETGWKWLEHTPGIPRPTAQNMYRL